MSPIRRSIRRRKVVIEVQKIDHVVSSSSDEDESSADSEEAPKLVSRLNMVMVIVHCHPLYLFLPSIIFPIKSVRDPRPLLLPASPIKKHTTMLSEGLGATMIISLVRPVNN